MYINLYKLIIQINYYLKYTMYYIKSNNSLVFFNYICHSITNTI